MKNKICYILHAITLLMFVSSASIIKPIKASAQNIVTLSNQAGTYTGFGNQNSVVDDKNLWASPLIGEYAIFISNDRGTLKISSTLTSPLVLDTIDIQVELQENVGGHWTTLTVFNNSETNAYTYTAKNTYRAVSGSTYRVRNTCKVKKENVSDEKVVISNELKVN